MGPGLCAALAAGVGGGGEQGVLLAQSAALQASWGCSTAFAERPAGIRWYDVALRSQEGSVFERRAGGEW